MVRQLVDSALPGQTANLLQAAGDELIEVTLDRAAGHVGQAGDGFVGEALALEPQDLHLLLDARMGVVVSLVADRIEIVGGEGEASHGGFLYS